LHELGQHFVLASVLAIKLGLGEVGIGCPVHYFAA
jgi:hypothetical protein